METHKNLMCSKCGFVFGASPEDKAVVECPDCGKALDTGRSASAFELWWSKAFRGKTGKNNVVDFESVEQQERENGRW